MAVLGPNILTILTKRSGTHISVCSMRLLVRIVLLVGHGTKWIIKANIWPKMTKYAYFGPNLAVFRPNIPIFTRRSKSFGIHINENHFCTLFALFFGRTWDQMGQKWQYLAKYTNFGTNLAVFGPKISIFWEYIKFWYPHNGKLPRHLVCIFWSGMGSYWPKMTIFGQKCQFWAKFYRSWAQNPFDEGGSKTFGTLISGNQWDTSFVLKTSTGVSPIGR